MPKRKFRSKCSPKKNDVRRNYANTSLPVSTKVSTEVMVFHVSIPLDLLKFVVSLPLNIFSFFNCNIHLTIPPLWSIVPTPTSDSLVLTKLRCVADGYTRKMVPIKKRASSFPKIVCHSA